MDRPTPNAVRQPAETRVLSLDLEEDFGDDSIYGMSYRSRVGVVVTDRVARETEPRTDAAAPTLARS
jgi:hypothetical protein